MNFTETPIPGAFVIEPERLTDERGFFARTFDEEEFRQRGLDSRVAQCSVSFNPAKGTLRGMHFQTAPYQEAKLVRCVRGAIHDVILDLRGDSSAYGRSFGVLLDMNNRRMTYVPTGCAHGFLTLCDDTEVTYQITTPYVAIAASGVRWNDPAFAIDWPFEPVVLSERDAAWPLGGGRSR